MNWSFQLYSARNFQPWEAVLAMLAEAGYAAVEGFPDLYGDPAGLRAALDRTGLAMPTGHFGLDMLEADFTAVQAIAETLGIRTVICPWLAEEQRPSGAAGWRDLARRLSAVNERCAQAGLGFAWHNHDFEFAPAADGSLPMETLLDAAPAIGWEIDVAWLVRGGADPLAWIDAHGDRIVAVHVKDIAPAGQAQDEDGWADIGHGTLDWSGLIAALREKTPARHFVLEHDNPADAGRFARRSIAAARAFGA